MGDLIEFENGELADANDVNANFNTLENRINNINIAEISTRIVENITDTITNIVNNSDQLAKNEDVTRLENIIKSIYQKDKNNNESGYFVDVRDNTHYYSYVKKSGSIEDGDTTYSQTGDVCVYSATKSGAPTITTEHRYTKINKNSTLVPITNNDFYWIKKTYSDLNKTVLKEIEYGGSAKCMISRSDTYCFDFEAPEDSDIENYSDKVYEFNFIVKEGVVPTNTVVGYSAFTPTKFLGVNFLPSGVSLLSHKAGCKGGAIRISKDSGSYGCVINWSKKIIV